MEPEGNDLGVLESVTRPKGEDSLAIDPAYYARPNPDSPVGEERFYFMHPSVPRYRGPKGDTREYVIPYLKGCPKWMLAFQAVPKEEMSWYDAIVHQVIPGGTFVPLGEGEEGKKYVIRNLSGLRVVFPSLSVYLRELPPRQIEGTVSAQATSTPESIVESEVVPGADYEVAILDLFASKVIRRGDIIVYNIPEYPSEGLASITGCLFYVYRPGKRFTPLPKGARSQICSVIEGNDFVLDSSIPSDKRVLYVTDSRGTEGDLREQLRKRKMTGIMLRKKQTVDTGAIYSVRLAGNYFSTSVIVQPTGQVLFLLGLRPAGKEPNPVRWKIKINKRETRVSEFTGKAFGILGKLLNDPGDLMNAMIDMNLYYYPGVLEAKVEEEIWKTGRLDLVLGRAFAGLDGSVSRGPRKGKAKTHAPHRLKH